MKRFQLFLVLALAIAMICVPVSVFGASKAVPKTPTVGVVFSGCGMMDGSEVSEAVLTMLYLEKAKVNIIYMAPNVNQTDTIDILTGQPVDETRNVLTESARISRGNIKDIATVKSSELDAIFVVGGLGSVKNLSDFLAKGVDCKVNPDFERLIREMWAAKKPIGSMCLASANLAKILGDKKVVLTIGAKDKNFVPMLEKMGAVHQACKVGDIVTDKKNLVVTTPAMMVGPSTSDIAVGIEKMINAVLKLTK